METSFHILVPLLLITFMVTSPTSLCRVNLLLSKQLLAGYARLPTSAILA